MKPNLAFVLILFVLCWLVSCSSNTLLKAQPNVAPLEKAEASQLRSFQYPPIKKSFAGGYIPVLVSYDEQSKLPLEIGFADKTGKLVSQTQRIKQTMGELSEGVLLVKMNEDKDSLLDTSGQFIATEFTFQALNNSYGFSEGLALVKMNGKLGFINKKGELAIEPQFEDASLFSDGLAFAVREGGLAGFINHNGEMLIPSKFDVIRGQHEPHTNSPLSFSDGRASMLAIEPKGYYKVGYIDLNGEWIIEPKFRKGFRFSEGLAGVLDENGKYGFINTKGEWIIKPQFSFASSFSEGLALAQNHSQKGGFIDVTGKVVIPFMFRETSSFSEGIASVKVDSFWGAKWGYIDSSGKWLAEPQFDYPLGKFIEGVAVISCNVKGKSKSFILSKSDLITRDNPKYRWCS